MVGPLLGPYEGCVMRRDGLEVSGCVRLGVDGCVRLSVGGCVRLCQVGCQVDIRWDLRLTWAGCCEQGG